MFVSGWKWKARKTVIPSPVQSYESLVSVKESTVRKRKKKTRKKERKKNNANRAQTKLNSPHVIYKFKILLQ